MRYHRQLWPIIILLLLLLVSLGCTPSSRVRRVAQRPTSQTQASTRTNTQKAKDEMGSQHTCIQKRDRCLRYQQWLRAQIDSCRFDKTSVASVFRTLAWLIASSQPVSTRMRQNMRDGTEDYPWEINPTGGPFVLSKRTCNGFYRQMQRQCIQGYNICLQQQSRTQPMDSFDSHIPRFSETLIREATQRKKR